MHRKTCEQCGDTFKTNRDGQTYCSYDCMHAAQRDDSAWEVGVCERDGCSTNFRYRPSRTPNRKFCSRECYRMNQIETNVEAARSGQ